jgi:hypothetical protein
MFHKDLELDDLNEVYSVPAESMACNGCMEGMSQRRILGTDVPFVCLSLKGS